MKNKFSLFNFKLFRTLRQILGNEYPDSKSEVKKNKVVVEDNLRWQDDGGPVVEIAKPPTDPAKPDDGTGNDSVEK